MDVRALGAAGVDQFRKMRFPSWLVVSALTLLTFLGIHATVRVFAVDGPSMQPGLHSGEYVAVNPLTYVISAPRRGDIVLLHPPNAPGETFIKRIVGVPGDSITLTPTAVLVNGAMLHENYIYPLAPGDVENTVVIPHLVLHQGQYFVLGDHRQESEDSRVFGPVPREDIIAKVSWLVWPLGAVHPLGASGQLSFLSAIGAIAPVSR